MHLQKTWNLKLLLNKKLFNKRGMSLLEIMIVLAIIASMAVFITNAVTGRLKAARIRQAKIGMSEISKFLDMYYTDCGSYPSTDQGLDALIKDPGSCANWGPDPYMKKVPQDPWGKPFVYEFDGSDYTLMTFGADRKQGGSGENRDLVNGEEAPQNQGQTN